MSVFSSIPVVPSAARATNDVIYWDGSKWATRTAKEALEAEIAPGTDGNVLTAASGAWTSAAPAGKVVGYSYVQDTTDKSTTNTAGYDDTIPQSSEMAQATSVAHTALSATNKLLITINLMVGGSTALHMLAALFIDSATGAEAATATRMDDNGAVEQIALQYEYTPGDASAHTYRAYFGGTGGGTKYLNRRGTGAYLGNKLISSMSILEIEA